MFLILTPVLLLSVLAAAQNQTAQPVAIAQYDGNCFACVNRGFMYCESRQECWGNLTSQNCTTGRILDMESGCPILNYCNTTIIETRGVITLENLKYSNSTFPGSLNKSGDGNLTLHLPGNFTPCYLALLN